MKYLFFLLWINNAFSSEMILSNTNAVFKIINFKINDFYWVENNNLKNG